MRIENQTRRTVLADEAEVADNIVTRFMGLMGRPALPQGRGMVIRPCTSIHMMFMRFPIDVVYVNRHDQVVRVAEGMRPWRVGPVVRQSRYVIELPPGTVARTGTRIGDQLRAA